MTALGLRAERWAADDAARYRAKWWRAFLPGFDPEECGPFEAIKALKLQVPRGRKAVEAFVSLRPNSFIVLLPAPYPVFGCLAANAADYVEMDHVLAVACGRRSLAWTAISDPALEWTLVGGGHGPYFVRRSSFVDEE